MACSLTSNYLHLEEIYHLHAALVFYPEGGYSKYLKTLASTYQTTVMCHLMKGICSKKCVVRWFHHCANII